MLTSMIKTASLINFHGYAVYFSWYSVFAYRL